MKNEVLNKIHEADMILIGIGEEFEDQGKLKKINEYNIIKNKLKELKYEWAIPMLNQYFIRNTDSKAMDALMQLKKYIEGKNYFIITTATNDLIWECGFKEERIVAPCGGSHQKQCKNCCPDTVGVLTNKDKECLYSSLHTKEWIHIDLGVCSVCGEGLILNNIYNEHYDEQGYLKQWNIYTKWLQGTLNKNICILELGVNLQYPSVIRWPFEKIAYYNQKSKFIRVHENLYQLDENLKDIGISIPKNAVDWLLF